MNTKELSAFLGISQRHAANLVNEGKIRRFKFGSSVRFLPSEVLEDLRQARAEKIRKEEK